MREDPFTLENLLLLDKLRFGDPDAFTSIYNLYTKPLFRKIMVMVKDEDIAKELLQDLFMKIWVNRERIDTSKSFKSYLNIIAANMVYDHFRYVAKNRVLAGRLQAMAVDYYSHTEESLICKDHMGLIRKAVEKLSPQRKKIFIMCRLDGKSYDEVSKELAISQSTIRDHMVKANRVVKDYLQSHPDLALCLYLTSIFLY